MSLYSEILYGNGAFYGPSSTDVPRDLRFYRTNTDGVYVFHWGFDPAFITPMLSTTDFDLELDSDPTFSSPALTFFTSTPLSAINYQNGNIRKGFAVPVQPRLDKIEQTWYARVRTRVGLNASDWSAILQFVIPQRWEVEEAENIMTNLPDIHVYGKEDLLKIVSQRNTNLYTVATMYGKELDQTLLENLLTTTNNYINLCRDENLYDNFGVLFDYQKPQTQQYVEYRMVLSNLILAALVGGTVDAVQRVVRSFTGVDPTLLLIRDRNDFFLSTLFETPPELPDNFRTFFSVSQNYIVGSLVVLKNGLVLSGVDFTENHVTPGFDMTVAPLTGDVLQVFFEIGLASDPVPLVFDINDTTPLTGTITFTNGSVNVTGVGSLFTTELIVGSTITDSTGLILGVVDTITDNFNLTLTEPWFGDTGTSSAKKLNYGESQLPPSIAWDQNALAYGVIIQVNNPGGFVLDQALIEMLTTPMLPSHVKVYYIFS